MCANGMHHVFEPVLRIQNGRKDLRLVPMLCNRLGWMDRIESQPRRRQPSSARLSRAGPICCIYDSHGAGGIGGICFGGDRFLIRLPFATPDVSRLLCVVRNPRRTANIAFGFGHGRQCCFEEFDDGLDAPPAGAFGVGVGLGLSSPAAAGLPVVISFPSLSPGRGGRARRRA